MALIIASACARVAAVRVLVRRGAKVCYHGKHGVISVWSVTISKVVKSWLQVSRFNETLRIKSSSNTSGVETKGTDRTVEWDRPSEVQIAWV